MTRALLLGADVGGTSVKFVVDDPGRSHDGRGETPTDPRSPRRTFAALARDVAALLGPGERIAGLGLACAGIVDAERAVLGRAPNLPGWEGVDLRAAAADAFPDARLAVANDVNAALVGEAHRGVGRGRADLVMLALGTGVGGAVMVANRLLTGHRWGAGEIGHMVLDPAGPVCGCGNHGCLEAYAGSRGLLAAARRAAAAGPRGRPLPDLVAARGDALTTRDLAALAVEDAAAAAVFRAAGERLGQAVGNLLNVLDPDLVIIGGGVAQAGDLLLAPCRETAARIVLCAAARETPIVAAELGPVAAAIGAAVMVRDAVGGT